MATRPSTSEPPDLRLAMVELGADCRSAGAAQLIAADWDRWPGPPVWAPDGSALVLAADSDGAAPLFRIELDGTVTRLTGDHGAYSDVCIDPAGQWVYAIRSAIDAPPAPVRVAASGADQQPIMLRGPATALPLPGSMTEVSTTAADGANVRAWLVLPEGASDTSPAPLLLWIHGGPWVRGTRGRGAGTHG